MSDQKPGLSKLFTKDGIHQADIYGPDPAKGGKFGRIKRSTGVKDDGTQKNYDKAWAKGEAEARLIASGVSKRSRSVTVEQAILELISFKTTEGKVSKHTIKRYRDCAVHLYNSLGERTKICDLTDQHLRDYAAKARETRSADSVNKELSTLVQGARLKGAALPVVPRLHTPEGEEFEGVFLDIEEQRALIESWPVGDYRRDLVALYLQMGCRRKEIYVIHKSPMPKFVRVKGTKTKKSDRSIWVTDAAWEIIQRVGLPMPAWSNHDRDIKLAAEAAGIDAVVSLNTLRHTFATMAVKGDVQPQKLAHTMGTSIRMLEKVYTHHGEQSSRDVMAVIPDPLKTGTPRDNVVPLKKKGRDRG